MVNGKTLRVPLEGFHVRGVEGPLIRAVVTLQVRTARYGFRDIEFLVDTGACLTTLPVELAQELGIPFPRRKVDVPVVTGAGRIRQVRHAGRIRVVVPTWGSEEFDWPCHYVEHEGRRLTPVLGLTGVLDDLRITLDGTYSLEARYGMLTLQRR